MPGTLKQDDEESRGPLIQRCELVFSLMYREVLGKARLRLGVPGHSLPSPTQEYFGSCRSAAWAGLSVCKWAPQPQGHLSGY